MGDEDQRWAALGIDAESENRWQDRQRHEDGGDELEDRDHDTGENDVGVVFQIAAVDNRATASQREREECLTEGVHPGFWISQRGPVWREEKFVASFRARDRRDEDRQPDKEEKEQRHDDLVGALDAGGNAGVHDDEREHDGKNVPADAAEIAGDLTKVGAGFSRKHAAGGCAEEKTQDPADDDGVADGHASGADERQESENAADLRAAALSGFAERAHRASAHGAAEGHFAHDATEAEANDEDQKRHEKREAAILADAIRKEPDAAHADRRADAAHNEAKTAAEGIAGRIVVRQVLSPRFFCLIFCCRQEPCAS